MSVADTSKKLNEEAFVERLGKATACGYAIMACLIVHYCGNSAGGGSDVGKKTKWKNLIPINANLRFKHISGNAIMK